MVVRPNPLLYHIPLGTANKSNMPHRCIFAVLTVDAVLIYDTVHDSPLAVARGLHYAGLTDAAWSADGKTLFVTSSDGYVSILSFANGELGETLVHEIKAEVLASIVVKESAATASNDTAKPAINVLAPKKKKKVTVNLDANVTTEIENVLDSNHVTVNTLVPKKKKKQIVSAPGAGESDCDSTKRHQQEAVNILVPKKKIRVDETEVKNVTVAMSLDSTVAVETGDKKNEVNVLVPKKKSKKMPPTTLAG